MRKKEFLYRLFVIFEGIFYTFKKQNRMSANLLELAKGYLTNEVVEKASSFLGEDSSKTKSAFEHMLPALMGGMLSKGNDKNGAAELFNMVSKPEFGGGLLGNLGGLFSQGESSSKTLDLGGQLLGSLFGNKLGGMTDLISAASGLKSGSTSSLMKLGLPILMSVIGKKVKTDGLGLDGFMKLLGGQQEFVQKAAPAGFMDKMLGTLGVGSLGAAAVSAVSGIGNKAGDVAGSVSKSVSDTAHSAKSTATNVANSAKATVSGGGNNNNKKKGGLARILPLLLVLGALVLAFLAFQKCGGKAKEGLDATVGAAKDGVTAVGDVAKDGVNAVGDAAKDGLDATVGAVEDLGDAVYSGGKDLIGKTAKGFEHLGSFVGRKLKGGVELVIPSKGGEAQMLDFIEGKDNVSDDKTQGWINLRRVLFQTGSANLDAKSKAQIDNIVAIMKAYPNIHLKVGGYTDNVGNPANNLKLSDARAKAVMTEIVKNGIDASRLDAEGYGEQHPVADNNTEEGKQLNRRVAVRITKK